MQIAQARRIMVRGCGDDLLAASALRADSRHSLGTTLGDGKAVVVVHTGLAHLVAGFLGIVGQLSSQGMSRHAGKKTVSFGVDAVSNVRVGTLRGLDALRNCGLMYMTMTVVVWQVGVDGHTIEDAAWGTIDGNLWDRLSVRCDERLGGHAGDSVVDSPRSVGSNILILLLGERIDGDGNSGETAMSSVGLGDSDDGDEGVLRSGDGRSGDGRSGDDLRSWSGSDMTQKDSASQGEDSKVCESQHCCF